MIIEPTYYQPASKDNWNGRIDGTDLNVQRWHQRIQPVNLQEIPVPGLTEAQQGIALIGFACDEGVQRNLGRRGAADGPSAFRRACSSLPMPMNRDLILLDLGDVICTNNNMEGAQDALAILIATTLKAGYHPLVIGGGHEVAYGHYNGIRQHTTASIGIINFDAHFDLRQPGSQGYSSGTGFNQIATDCHETNTVFHYLPLGIQKTSNTKHLFDQALALNVQHVPAEWFSAAAQAKLMNAVNEFINAVDHIYLTVCLDVFSAAFAPGVSAPAYAGIFPDQIFFDCFTTILKSEKVISMDIAELNPSFDRDQQTAKLAAALAFEFVSQR